MSDLYELLAPYFDVPDSTSPPLLSPPANAPQTSSYLNRLNTLSLTDLTSTEPSSLIYAAHSHLRNLQALSKRSHRAVISSSAHLANLSSLLPALGAQANDLQNELPQLETAATEFARKYDKSKENAVLDRRKRATLLSQNVDRVSDILELPTLLSSTVVAAQAPGAQAGVSSATSYTSALELHAHIKRLRALYPQSELVGTIAKQAEVEIQNLTAVLITSLQSPSLKLPAAMRTIGGLRRVAPDLAGDRYSSFKPAALSAKSLDLSHGAASADGTIAALFLICRLHTLHKTLEALEPLRELADQESAGRNHVENGAKTKHPPPSSALGSQSERYLKRYIEIFREQSFSIVRMYTSIFPSGLPSAEASTADDAMGKKDDVDGPLLPLPAPIASFALHLTDMLTAELRKYMPNITDQPSRESLLTQVLYCAGSLGRLGADFGMMIALLEEELSGSDDGGGEETRDADPEWTQVMKKHRVQASRLEVLARGVGGGRKGSAELHPAAALPAG